MGADGPRFAVEHAASFAYDPMRYAVNQLARAALNTLWTFRRITNDETRKVQYCGLLLDAAGIRDD